MADSSSSSGVVFLLRTNSASPIASRSTFLKRQSGFSIESYVTSLLQRHGLRLETSDQRNSANLFQFREVDFLQIDVLGRPSVVSANIESPIVVITRSLPLRIAARYSTRNMDRIDDVKDLADRFLGRFDVGRCVVEDGGTNNSIEQIFFISHNLSSFRDGLTRVPSS